MPKWTPTSQSKLHKMSRRETKFSLIQTLEQNELLTSNWMCLKWQWNNNHATLNSSQQMTKNPHCHSQSIIDQMILCWQMISIVLKMLQNMNLPCFCAIGSVIVWESLSSFCTSTKAKKWNCANSQFGKWPLLVLVCCPPPTHILWNAQKFEHTSGAPRYGDWMAGEWKQFCCAGMPKSFQIAEMMVRVLIITWWFWLAKITECFDSILFGEQKHCQCMLINFLHNPLDDTHVEILISCLSDCVTNHDFSSVPLTSFTHCTHKCDILAVPTELLAFGSDGFNSSWFRFICISHSLLAHSHYVPSHNSYSCCCGAGHPVLCPALHKVL